MKLDIENVPNLLVEAQKMLNTRVDENDMNGIIYFDYDKIQTKYKYHNEMMEHIRNEIIQELYFITGELKNWYNPRSYQDNLTVLQKFLGIPYKDLLVKGKPSASSEVVNRLLETNNSRTLHLMKEFYYHYDISKSLKPYYTKCEKLEGRVNNEGKQLGWIPKRQQYKKTVTNRFTTEDPNISGLSRHIFDIITAPEGWKIVSVDTAQFEPMMLYSTLVNDPMIRWLIREYGDAYYALTDYTLRPSTAFTPENTYKLGNISKTHRDLVKLILLSSNYGASEYSVKKNTNKLFKDMYYRTSEGRRMKELISKKTLIEKMMNNPNVPEVYKTPLRTQYTKLLEDKAWIDKQGIEFANKVIERIIKHPMRMEFLEGEKLRLNRGERTVASLFGDEITISGDYKYLLNCCINNKFQMTASRLSAISVVEGIKFALNNHDNVRFAFHRLDEDVYYIKEEHADQLTRDFLVPLREYEISDWETIKSNYTIGDYYSK